MQIFHTEDCISFFKRPGDGASTVARDGAEKHRLRVLKFSVTTHTGVSTKAARETYAANKATGCLRVFRATHDLPLRFVVQNLKRSAIGPVRQSVRYKSSAPRRRPGADWYVKTRKLRLAVGADSQS